MLLPLRVRSLSDAKCRNATRVASITDRAWLMDALLVENLYKGILVRLQILDLP